MRSTAGARWRTSYETSDELVICLELPGLEQAQIDVRVDGDELLVEGERE